MSYPNARPLPSYGVPTPLASWQLGDVHDTAAPVDGDALQYNESTGVYEPRPALAISSAGGAAGEVLTSDGTTWSAAPPPTTDKALYELLDVDPASTTAPAAGQVLKYDGTLWAASADIIDGYLRDLLDVDPASTAAPAAGQVLKYDGTLWAAQADAVGGSTFLDDVFRVLDDGDATKQLAFEVSGVPTATTRTMTVPNADGTLVLEDATQTLTAKSLVNPIIRNPGSSFDTQFTVGNNSAASIVTLGITGASEVVSMQKRQETLTNKVLGTNTRIQDSNASHLYSISPGNLVQNVSLGLPALASSDTLVTENFAAELTNKTLDSVSNTVLASKLATTGTSVVLTAGAPPSSGQVLTASGPTAAAWSTPVVAPTAFSDDVFRVQDDGDATKKIAFQVSGVTTATTRTYTAPDASGTLVLDTAAQVVSNKAMGPGWTIQDSDQSHVYNIVPGDQTSNADLRLPVLTSSADTIVVTNEAQTLQNKTITLSTNFVRASELGTSGASVQLNAGAPPTAGQHLVASSATAASWATPAAVTYKFWVTAFIKDVSGPNELDYAPALPLNDLSPALLGSWVVPRAATLRSVTAILLVDAPAGAVTAGTLTVSAGSRAIGDGYTDLSAVGTMTASVNSDGKMVVTGLSQAYAAGDQAALRITTDGTFAWSRGPNSDMMILVEFETS